ncbi:MAG: hypothetical protein LBS44_06125 [Deltaproteobacteria bacterium]|jgi:uncharacterized Zn finger protein|nr:hypothetical protein [Deltaproteobacteria bacterium]
MSWYKRKSYSSYYFQSRPKVNVDKLKRSRNDISPVVIEGRTIAKTFWGQRWCSHFEGMADFDNRLPRGRTYVRNGSVFHLEINPGQVLANVAGSDIYTVKMEIDPLPLERWEAIKRKCLGRISTIIDLLMGRFSPEVMDVVCDPREGLFPLEKEIKYKCSCPDWASLCKHVAATFYGIGSRLDLAPELLFLMRRVDPNELLASGADLFLEDLQTPTDDTLNGDLGAIFGIDLAVPVPETAKPVANSQVANKMNLTSAAKQKPSLDRLTDDELKEAIAKITQSRIENPVEETPLKQTKSAKKKSVPDLKLTNQEPLSESPVTSARLGSPTSPASHSNLSQGTKDLPDRQGQLNNKNKVDIKLVSKTGPKVTVKPMTTETAQAISQAASKVTPTSVRQTAPKVAPTPVRQTAPKVAPISVRQTASEVAPTSVRQTAPKLTTKPKADGPDTTKSRTNPTVLPNDILAAILNQTNAAKEKNEDHVVADVIAKTMERAIKSSKNLSEPNSFDDSDALDQSTKKRGRPKKIPPNPDPDTSDRSKTVAPILSDSADKKIKKRSSSTVTITLKPKS